MPAVIRAPGDGPVMLRIRRGTTMAEDWMVTTGDGSISAELPPIRSTPTSRAIRDRMDERAVSSHSSVWAARADSACFRPLGEGGHRFFSGRATGHRLTPY
jgi:hypothetical protein